MSFAEGEFTDYQLLNDKELINEYHDWLVEYSDWIAKNIKLENGWESEIEYMIYVRDEIETVTKVILQRKLNYESQSLKDLDKKWLTQCKFKSHKATHLSKYKDNGSLRWWYHLDDRQFIKSFTLE